MLCLTPRLRTILFALALSPILPLTAHGADYFKEATAYHQKGETRAAVIQLKNLLKDSPDHAQGRLLLGRIYLDSGQFAEAEKELRRAHALGVEQQAVTPPLAEALVATEQFDQALNMLFVDWGSEGPDQYRRWALIGRARLGQQQFDEAENAFYRSIQEQPNNMAQLGLALVAQAYGKTDEALKQLLPISGDGLIARRATLLRAELLRSQSNYDEALASYNQAISLEPDNLPARMGRARTAIQAGQVNAADEDIALLLDKAPQLPQVRVLAALSAIANQQYEDANTHAQMLLQMIPESPQGLLLAGSANYHLGQFNEAEKLLRQMVSLLPQNLTGNRILVAALMRQNKPKQALSLVEPLLARGETDPALRALAGNAYLMTGDLEAGERLLLDAMDELPANDALVNQVALSRALSGRGDDAISMLESTDSAPTLQSDAVRVIAMMRNGDAADATNLIGQRISEQPDALNYRLLLALLQQQSGDLNAAQTTFDTASQRAPDNPAPLIGLARLALQNEQPQQAADYFKRALAVAPDHLGAMLGMAATAEQLNNPTELRDWLKQARQKHPDAIAPVKLLVRHFINQQNTDRALAEAHSFFMSHEEQVEAGLLYAGLLRGNREPARAVDLLQPLRDANPGHQNLAIAVAQLHKDQGQFEQALAIIDKIVGKSPVYSSAGVLQAELLILNGRPQEAEAMLKQFWESQQAPVLARLRTAAALALKDPAGAQQFIDQLYPKQRDPQLLQMIISAQRQLNGAEGVIRFLTEHVGQFPDDPFALMQLASLEHQRGNLQVATERYEQLRVVQPGNPVAWNNLAWLYHDANDKRDLEYAREAHRLAPESPDIKDTLGWILLNTGNPKEGLKILKQAAQGLPDNSEVQFHLATALVENKQHDEAKRLLQTLSNASSPFKPQAEALLRQLN